MSYSLKNMFLNSQIIDYFYCRNEYAISYHSHSHTEFVILLSGEMKLICDECVYNITNNCAIMIPPCFFHSIRLNGESFTVMINTKTNCDDAIKAYSINNDISKIVSIHNKVSCSKKSILELIFQYISEKQIPLYTDTSEDSLIFDSVVKYMRQKIFCKVCMAQILEHCNICKTRLEAIFSYYTGMGCMSYYNKLRLETAREMLLNGEDCRNVSDKLCFSSLAYFSNVFKKKYGVSPSKICNQD